MKVKLSATGNPDFGQYGSIGVQTRRVVVRSLSEASRLCRHFIETEDLGSGNWTGGQVYEDGKKIAQISYNGRVWGQ